MGRILLHGSARTTPAIRTEIKELYNTKKLKVKEISGIFNISRPTVYKWIKRKDNKDLKMGTKTPNTVLTKLEEQIICATRRSTLLSLDDLYIVLKDKIPKLSRSNLHRCLQRNGISNLEDIEEYKKININNKQTLEEHYKEELKNKIKNNPYGNKFKDYDIGYVHIDITTILLSKTEIYYLYVAIDRISKYVHYKLYNEQTKKTAIDFLNEVYNIFPFKIHTILTDNGIQFSNTSLKGLNNVKNTEQPTSKSSFTKKCESLNIKHKTTQVKHPWTNGQVEVFNRFIKDNTIKKYKYISKEQLLNHLDNLLIAYNFAKRLKSLKYITPYQKVLEIYNDKNLNNNNRLFRIEPVNQLMGLNNRQATMIVQAHHCSASCFS